MGVILGHHQYGKSETRVVRIYRDEDRHELVDYNVSVSLTGDFIDVHVSGENSSCLTTDAVNAFAKRHGEEARQPESFGLALARHFVDDVPQVSRARISLEMYGWVRLEHSGRPQPHAFRRDGGHVRTATVTYDGRDAWVVSGVGDLVVLKTTDSEFFGFYEDRYTTLEPTHDRVMATAVRAQWWHAAALPPGDALAGWERSFSLAVMSMTDAFAGHHSLALQQTLYQMGTAVIDRQPGIGEIRLSLPNKHHFAVDLSPFGLENPNEVFYAADRPYGLIEGTVRRDDAPDPGPAFDPGRGWP